MLAGLASTLMAVPTVRADDAGPRSGQVIVDPDDALGYYQRSLEIRERLAPDSLGVAAGLSSIGVVYRDRGDLDAALNCHQRSLDIRERLAPESSHCAYSYACLGRVVEANGDLPEARRRYEQACATLEAAREKSAGEAEARATFAARYTSMYRDLIRVLLKLGDADAASETAERMRAQGFREQLVERTIAAEVTPELGTRQTSLDTRRNRLYDELRGIAGRVPDETRSAQISAELSRLQLGQEVLTREIRAADPRYADLVYPQPMAIAELEQALDPGTLALSYVVDDDVTRLFVFGRGLEVVCHDIAVGSDELGTRVVAYLSAMSPRREQQDGDETRLVAKTAEEWRADTVEAERVSAELGALLLGPVEGLLTKSSRVLVLPDGPLWALPFQALTVDGRPVHEAVPIHYAPSATVLVRERDYRKRIASAERLLAVGDRRLGAGTGAGGDRAVYMPIRGGAFEVARRSSDRLGFTPIPFSGVEASLIDTAFGPESDIRQGLMATEACVRRKGPGRRVPHLATHGLLDPLSPMDSAVVLSPGPDAEALENDGFLKAWEVFGLHLDGCDLVTLSACETARGKTLSGEGVIGLTRAFLYAGAASVLCTQWSVADDSTAALMVRFYTHYREGDPKDVALQKAMGEIRTGKLKDGSPLELPDPLSWREEWSHPYYWAPFILVGEWQQRVEAGRQDNSEERLHSSMGGLTPSEFVARWASPLRATPFAPPPTSEQAPVLTL